ncbi:uncharacterized protein LOC129600269 [Paramacrobiotus metropolitanus]|uniref:uncharacterized protein LOC129600269 n=1 Tax=Paramacrobiotus metropolitanus TaxID=2943436 RepID=UPI0024465641|nr:uncharacterized protein LOC129600269 [Paramacrobiotus metropolitanus]
MTDSMHYSVLLVVMLATVPNCMVFGDSSEPRLTTLQRAALAVQQAEASMTDNVVILPTFKNAAAGAFPATHIVRVPLGAVARFSCDAAAQRILWRHNNATVHDDGIPRSPKGHYYRPTSSANTSSLLIHNVTREAAGTVECLFPCNGDLCVLRQFELQLRLRVEDDFTEPMRNVSTPLLSFSMTCSGRVDCSQTGSRAHFIWKFDGRFLVAPYRYLQTIAETSHIPGLRYGRFRDSESERGAAQPICANTLTIGMGKMTSNRTARVDCWMRPDSRNHEWFVQSAYVHFTPFAALDEIDIYE